MSGLAVLPLVVQLQSTTANGCKKPTSKPREAGVGRRLGAEARGAIAPRLLKLQHSLPFPQSFWVSGKSGSSVVTWPIN